MLVTVDKIEKGIAKLLIRPAEKESFTIPVQELPEKVIEGSILKLKFENAAAEKNSAEKRVSSLLDRLQNKSKQ
jgi:hypothetical protein